MGSFNLTVVFLPLIIKLSSCSDHHTSVLKCIQTEREALLSFKEGLDRTDEYGWHPDDWVGEDCCQWDGVECNNKSGHVTKLFLKNWRLSGFWSVCGTLLVKKSWRYWCFSFCDDIKNRIALIIALKIVHLTRKFGLENN
nr:receptor-like protein 12 [Quercus suber]